MTGEAPGALNVSESIYFDGIHFKFQVHRTNFCHDRPGSSKILEPLVFFMNSATSEHFEFLVFHKQRIVDNRGFCSFHKSDRSAISANVVDICLCINIML